MPNIQDLYDHLAAIPGTILLLAVASFFLLLLGPPALVHHIRALHSEVRRNRRSAAAVTTTADAKTSAARCMDRELTRIRAEHASARQAATTR